MSMFGAYWKSLSASEKVTFVMRTIFGVAIVGAGAACYKSCKESKDIVKAATKKIADGVDVEISDEVVRKAIEKAARDSANKAVRDAAESAMKDIRDEVNTQVTRSVRDCYGQITDAVGDRIKRECEKMYKEQILEDVKENATKKLTEKFDSKLDDIAEKYTENLDNMGKIYGALADKLSTKA